EGGGSDEYTNAKHLFYSEPALFERLMEKLTRAISRFLQLQIDAGADAVQIFDSLGGCLIPEAYPAASGTWLRRIISSLKSKTPVIVFARGVHTNWQDLVHTGATVLGIDWQFSVAAARKLVPATVA